MNAITLSIDRIQLAVALIVQLEDRIPFPRNLSILHPIRLIKQAEMRVPSTRCAICASEGPLEQHHIAGRENLPDTITLCKTCHNELTNLYQPKWLPWNGEKKSLECYFLGLSDIFYLLWVKAGHSYFHELSKVFALNARYQC